MQPAPLPPTGVHRGSPASAAAAALFGARPGVGITIPSAPGADPVVEARHAEALGSTW